MFPTTWMKYFECAISFANEIVGQLNWIELGVSCRRKWWINLVGMVPPNPPRLVKLKHFSGYPFQWNYVSTHWSANVTRRDRSQNFLPSKSADHPSLSLQLLSYFSDTGILPCSFLQSILHLLLILSHQSIYYISFYTWSKTFLQCDMRRFIWSLQRLKEIQCWDAYFNLGLERIFCFNIFNIFDIFNKCIFCRLCICICMSALNLKCICQVYMTIFGVYSVFVMYFWPAGEVY